MRQKESVVPSKFTNTAGSLALGASGLWLISLAVFLYEENVHNDWNTTVYLVWTASVLAAGALTFVATLGLRQRHSTAGTLGTVGLVILGFGVVASIVTWAAPGWMLIQGVGMLLIVLAIRSEGLVPRLASLAYGLGMVIGVVGYGVLTLMKVGTPDQYGDYPVAWTSGITVGLVIVAVGLFGIGTWLRSETHADTAAMPEQTPVL
jgi:hypothetical protein